MSESDTLSLDISLTDWIAQAKGNEQVQTDRQAVHVLLNAIGINNNLKSTLYLKGGTLFAIAFQSERVTADVDFTCMIKDHTSFTQELSKELNKSMQISANKLGYLDTIFKVQTIKKMPRPTDFPDASFPALKVTIAYAKRGTSLETRLKDGKCPLTITVDISFKEQVYAFQELHLDTPLISIRAYSLIETAAEKYRAIIQQEERNRIRRQDVYDLYHLISQGKITLDDRDEITRILRRKCESRKIAVGKERLRSKDIYKRSQKEWHTLADEIPGELPDFDIAFKLVKEFYENLNWEIMI